MAGGLRVGPGGTFLSDPAVPKGMAKGESGKWSDKKGRQGGGVPVGAWRGGQAAGRSGFLVGDGAGFAQQKVQHQFLQRAALVGLGAGFGGRVHDVGLRG